MSRRRLLGRALAGALAGLGAITIVAAPTQAAPPSGMPDPSQMSGIPRADPNLAPGTITVRCLDGSFANPAIGVTVTLSFTGDDGSVSTVEATSADQGRATFADLDVHFGHAVVASATIAGQELGSQRFVLTAQSGVALMLVASGGSADGAGGPPGSPGSSPEGSGDGGAHGGQGAVPLPGKPFPLAGRPRGTLIVGALDLGRDDDPSGNGERIGPIAGVEVTLRATVPGQVEPIILTATTDSEGRATFENLDTSLPEGAAIVVEAPLEAEAEPTRSQSFTLGETAYAIVLTRGTAGAGTAEQGQGAGQGAGHGQAPAQTQRIQLPGPRVDKELGEGQVRVFLLDGHDRPVANHPVLIHSSQATGGASNRSGTTDAGGMAIIDGVLVGEDTLAQLRVVYDGAPYSSTMFAMPQGAGATVALRVFATTADRSKVRSALQIDVSPRENDFAAVTFMYAAYVDGDEAFWVPGGMRLYGPDGTRSLHVLPEAEAWLFHDGEAPWVEVDRPLEPGVELRLSFAVGIEHDGSLELEWSAPFPMVDGASLVSVPAELSVTHGVAGAPEVNPHAGRDGGPIELYELGHQRFVPRVCDLLAQAGQPCVTGTWGGSDLAIVVEELPVRSRFWPITAWTLLALTAVGVGLGVALRPRVGTREALLLRRDALIAELVSLDTRGDQPDADQAELRRKRARALATLDRIYRQLEVIGSAEHGDGR